MTSNYFGRPNLFNVNLALNSISGCMFGFNLFYYLESKVLLIFYWRWNGYLIQGYSHNLIISKNMSISVEPFSKNPPNVRSVHYQNLISLLSSVSLCTLTDIAHFITALQCDRIIHISFILKQKLKCSCEMKMYILFI